MREWGPVIGLGLVAVLTVAGLTRLADRPTLQVAEAAPVAVVEHRLEPITVQARLEALAVLEREKETLRRLRALANLESVEAAPVAPPAPVIAIQEAQERPRRWRRSRNRYPGRIPSPSEWQAPDGPIRIGLQAGHWRASEAPRELSGIKGNGTRWQHIPEWEVNLAIAREAAEMLEAQGYEVDILPAVVPPGYRAHLFISIHADGAGDPNAHGYRVASPSRDATGRASAAAAILADAYGEATGIRRLPDTTRRMRNYYAFNYRRYEHALHPMTIAVILETGFLTSARDRRIIVDDQDRAARGIVAAVNAYSVTALADSDGQD